MTLAIQRQLSPRGGPMSLAIAGPMTLAFASAGGPMRVAIGIGQPPRSTADPDRTISISETPSIRNPDGVCFAPVSRRTHADRLTNVLMQRLARPDYADTLELREVDRIATSLLAHLNTPSALAAIHAANLPGASSGMVQMVFAEFAKELGFENEKKGLFSNVELGLRPDYYCRVGASGIILEVERGKTTINNMDLLDFWKCHLCEHANYLFLVVPKALRQNATMAPRNEFAKVSRRLARFFLRQNYTNVRAAFVFGY
jgi:hypothetical protein